MKTEKQSNSVNSVESLYSALEVAKAELALAKNNEQKIKDTIISLYSGSISKEYSEKGDKFGTVNIEDSGFKLTFITPKKVKWDQDGLKELLDEGAPVQVEYDVSENVFKGLNDAGKAAFMPYRTVEPGSMTIKIERVEQ